MKKFLMTFLGIVFLLPVVAYAGSYCVSFPTSGETKWTKRDNNIGVRFRYDFDTDEIPSTTSYNPPFWTTGGALRGSGRANPRVKDYTYYPYSTPDLCIYDPTPDFGSVDYTEKGGRDESGTVAPRAKEVRLDVRWGGDCEAVSLYYGHINGNHQFEIYHRKGDLVNPFGCRRK